MVEGFVDLIEVIEGILSDDAYKKIANDWMEKDILFECDGIVNYGSNEPFAVNKKIYDKIFTE